MTSKSEHVDAVTIESTIKNWTQALVNENYETWINYWTEDAMLLPPGHATLKGHAEILSFVRDSFARVDTFSFSDWRIEGQGDLAVVVNHILWGDTALKQMIALRHWNGEWKVQLVMINSGVAG